jgi:spore maturation protein B
MILLIVLYGLFRGVNVFEAFVEGAKEGAGVVLSILPTLVGLLLAVEMFRTSGALDGILRLLKPIFARTSFPYEVVPVALIRTISSSAAIGLVLDLFKVYGPDSFIGRFVSILFGCTETVFYTMSVYFMTIKIKKSRYTLAGALLASFVGVMSAYFLSNYLFPR